MLKPKATHFLQNLMVASTIEEACRMTKISKKTAYKYMDDPEFKQEHLEAKREAMKLITARLQRLSSKALDTLENVLDDPEANPSTKVTASKNVLEFAYRGFEDEDISARLEQIERLTDI